jgi:hypothetical protein
MITKGAPESVLERCVDLVIFAIRTRRVPFYRSRPSLPITLTPSVSRRLTRRAARFSSGVAARARR